MRLLRNIFDLLKRRLTFHESIDLTDYVAHLERHFGVNFGVAELELLHTLGDLADLISRKLAEGGRAESGDAVWSALRRITAKEMGVDDGELDRGIRFVEDLCC